VRIWSPRNAAVLAEEMNATPVGSAEAAARGADVIVVATTSKQPVLFGEWVSPGTHINAVGAARPDWRELDDDLVRRANIYVDSRAAATVESGDVRAAETIQGEIGEVFAGRLTGREREEEITVFKSVGVAVEDVAAARLVLEALGM
jgi:ornithine cyclodeaminase/alanine dehydrogenase-like protein (mu-crystallin family)